MYDWYFTKGFWMSFPTRRHDWKSVVVWIDNPDLETPKIVGVAMSTSDTRYYKQIKTLPTYFAGFYMKGWRFNRTYIYGSNTSVRFQYDLIMWEQLTDAARVALNDSNNFGKAEVPFSDEHYGDHLDEAWPL
ncbi:hypothetical protein PHYPSEUDO_009512 [Phytophthora pseudosyringae]|uniref:Necrosis inducing protein NPP1 n=1 Tax=Phytophthora pseudosyringae TaxID=221518 RepID=A0A8T1VBQ8_9STRA|nr:hypothetical protein PHYPSEUDO_009512 [Phytophthora pseudosyringae]